MRDPVALEFDLSTGKRGETRRPCQTAPVRADRRRRRDARQQQCSRSPARPQHSARRPRGDRVARRADRDRRRVSHAGHHGAEPARDCVEVGTTNRTHPRDYRAALTGETGVILKVHTSNYRIQGFTADVGDGGTGRDRQRGKCAADERSRLGHACGPFPHTALPKEPTVREAVAEGGSVVTFSGDKLLGGPQAGFIVGKRTLIAGDQPQPDEACAARRQDAPRGHRGHAEALPRSRPPGRSACRHCGF